MVLARGEADIRVVPLTTGSPLPPLSSLVIAVAADIEERVRIVRGLDDDTPTLLVARPEDAVAFLGTVAEGSLPAAESDAPGADPASQLHIDSDARFAAWDDRRVALSPLEHDLLRSLWEDLGHVRTFAWLQEHVWGNDHPGNRQHVQSLVKRVRRKLKQLGTPLEIDAVRGVGLRLVHPRSGPSTTDDDDASH